MLRAYRCPCGYEWDELLNERNEKYPLFMPCPNCGQNAEYVWAVSAFSRPMKNYRVDFSSGYDLGAGRYFDTKSERNEWMAQNNLKLNREASGSIVHTDEKFIRKTFVHKRDYVPRGTGESNT